MSKIVKVVSNITDLQKVTLFHPDGASTTIPQGDPRLAAAMKIIIPMNHRGEIATVNLSTFEVYSEVAQKSSGLLKFFRVAKQKLKDFLSGSEEKPEPSAREIQAEEIEPEEAELPLGDESLLVKDEQAKAERFLEQHAVVQSTAVPLSSTETVAAVVGGQIISDVEKVEPFLKHAMATGRTEAVNNFFKLCAEVIKDRRHSVEDLFSFLERASLPLSDDGHILAYKMLQNPVSINPKEGGYYVDGHTKRVFQRPGCEVRVPDHLVDLSRDRDCSNGLHIASRQYLRTFGGDVIMLCKIDPRDVMAVPHSDVTKVRVRAYHILGILSQEAMARIKSDRPITDLAQDHALLTGAMQGKHIPVLETILIQGQRGMDIKHTEHAENTPDLWKTFLPSDLVPADTAALSEITKETASPPITPAQIREMAVKAEPETEEGTVSPPSVKTATAPNKTRQAHSVWLKNKDRLNFTTFLAAKKKAKKGWDVLGFTDEEVKEIKATIKKYDL